MKTTTGAALEAYHKELAEAQKQVGVSGSQWEPVGVSGGLQMWQGDPFEL